MEIERRVGRYALFDDTYIFNFAALTITCPPGEKNYEKDVTLKFP